MEVSHETPSGNLVHKACPICGSTNFKHYLKAKSYRVNTEVFNIDQCQDCMHAFTNPVPNEDVIGEYYKSENYISHTNSSKSFLDVIYQKARNISLAKKEGLLAKYSSDKSQKFLDYGSGTGHFVDYLFGKKWNVVGIEVSEEARNNSNSRIANNLFGLEYLDKIKGGELSGFSMWHVLEHVYEPKKLLNKLHGKLKGNGKGFIAVPNYLSEDAKMYGEHWAALDVPLHFSHFSKQSMEELLSRTGFKLVEVLNMPFDAYYISMISEKLSGKGNIANAFYKGWKSNLKGRNSKNMSSLIYVIEKA